MLILPMGFTGPETESLQRQLGVALDRRGNVEVDAVLASSVPGVFTAGDAMRGASLRTKRCVPWFPEPCTAP